jgi:pimeloyl-ACP methyl ester carboxylesterase
VNVTVNGVSLHVEDDGAGTPVLLLHGWPDSARLWRHQVPALVEAGYRVICPDQRGFGRSDRPRDVAAYRADEVVADALGLLDALDVESAHVVGHDWGAFVAWLLGIRRPDRVRSLTSLSVPHPAVPRSLRQREMAWYQLFFQFEGVAEAWLQHDDWRLFRELARNDGDIDQYLADLSRPGALTASLNWYRANLAPQLPRERGTASPWHRLAIPTFCIWSENDHYLEGARVRASAELVSGRWRYEQIPDASHWIPLDQPQKLNDLLLDWLNEVEAAGTPPKV